MSTAMETLRSIVYADDDSDDREFFTYIIATKCSQCKLEYVSNGIQLMQLLEHIYPDLVFLDLDMPYKNGLECLVEIRKNERLADLPIIVFSSTSKPSNINTAYEMGAHLFLIKPPGFEKYTSMLEAILSMNWKQPEQIREAQCIDGNYVPFEQ
jgi:CheY-like chemotaxis protein